MTSAAVRSIIREVLAEELKRIGQERAGTGQTCNIAPTKEVVTVNSDADLQSLVQHILKISHDKTMSDRIARGDHVFILANSPEHLSNILNSRAVSEPSEPQTVTVEIADGYLSERRVDSLPEGTRVVRLAPGVRFTPLARDRLRQRKIAVERMR